MYHCVYCIVVHLYDGIILIYYLSVRYYTAQCHHNKAQGTINDIVFHVAQNLNVVN